MTGEGKNFESADAIEDIFIQVKIMRILDG